MRIPATHPSYASHFINPLYEDDTLDAAPFGSDEGGDLLAEIELGLRKIETGDRIASVIPPEHLALYFPAAEKGDVDGLFEIYAAGFLLLRFNGSLEVEDYHLLRSALDRLAIEPEMEPLKRVVIPDLDSFMSH